jgi:hypothetical protein
MPSFPRAEFYRTVTDTVYLYPIADINTALRVTQQPYKRVGNVIIVPNLTVLDLLCYDIWYVTSQSNPDPGNPSAGGYSVGRYTSLQDMGQELVFQLNNGSTVLIWRNVLQLSPQSTLPVGNRGNSKDGTIGYVPVFTAFGGVSSNIDAARVVRTG